MSIESSQRYNQVSQVFHWLIAGMIVCQYIVGHWAEEAAEADAALLLLAHLANHKSLGMTILFLAILRLAWRFLSPPPALPDTMSVWQVRGAQIAHWALYFLLFSLPISGWLMSSASAYTVSWFNLFEFPDLVGADADLKATLQDAHHLLAKVLFVVAALHLLAALKHHLVDKDNVLTRMLRVPGFVLFVLTIAAGVFAFRDPTSSGARANEATSDPRVTIVADSITGADSTLPIWQIDYTTSSIRFTAEQAGAEFEGIFTDWQAEIQFDPANLAASRALVVIRPATVETYDEERNSTLLSGDWFDTEAFPAARFQAGTFTNTAQHEQKYQANGTLTIRQHAAPVVFDFELMGTDNQLKLTGGAKLDRLALQLGTGDWADTSWVGQWVQVEVLVNAELPN